VKSYQELCSESLTAEVLQEQIDAEGYALIREAIPAIAVNKVLADVTRVLGDAGWMSEGTLPTSRIPAEGASYGDPDPEFKAVYQQVFNLESFHALPHQSSLTRIMRMLTGGDVLVHPKPIGRLIFPDCERLVVRPHQDYEFMKGDTEFYTVWIPLHDCSVESGSLRILEGSHRLGILDHMREGLHVPELQLDEAMDENWVSGTINAGDVLIFHSCTVHASNPNVSQLMRLSIDCRFQDAHRELNPSNLVFAGESGKSWEKTYSGWQSAALQYYWKELPLNLNPSRARLQELAATTSDVKVRDRYARIASQLV
jgi:ectoine hydroxylase-related dioxygenase (phytanoyl-CoA dioxygenase family)